MIDDDERRLTIPALLFWCAVGALIWVGVYELGALVWRML